MHAPESLGPYRVVRALGRGAMGSVYEVVEPLLGRRAALKLLRAAAGDEAMLERFEREAHILARLQHPGVVRVHRIGQLQQGPFIVEELVEGERLRDLVARGPLEPRRAAQLARGLADALAAVHALGVVHRDLKPENVMVRPDGAPVLLDFGVARDTDAETLTRTGALVGTVCYMAPEQVRGAGLARGLDGRADVYALGVVLYELLAGCTPFDGPPLEVMFRALHEPPPPLPAHVPADLAAVVRVALEKDRARRHADAAAMRDDLDRFLAGQPTLSAARPTGRGRAGRAAALAGGAAALVLALALGAWAARRPDVAPPAPATAEEPARTSEARGPGRALDLVTRAVAAARAGDAPRAQRLLREARAHDAATAEAGLLEAGVAAVGSWRRGDPPEPVVRRLDTLAAAWAGARLPAAAAGPLATLAEERLTRGGERGVRDAALLMARARALDPAQPLPAGLELAAARLGKEDLIAGRFDDAALLLVRATEAGALDPARVDERDLLALADRAAFARLLAGEPEAPVPRLWAGLADAAVARRDGVEGAGRAAARRAVERLDGVRRELPPLLAATASACCLRIEPLADAAAVEARAEALAAGLGAEAWRVERQAAHRLRPEPARAVVWARRALATYEAAGAPDPAVRADLVEALAELLRALGRDGEADALLRGPR